MTQVTEQQSQSNLICPHCGQPLINPVYNIGQSLRFKTKDGYNLTGNIIDIYGGDIDEGYPPAARVFVSFTNYQFYYVDLWTLKEISESEIAGTTDRLQSIVVNNSNQLPLIQMQNEEVIKGAQLNAERETNERTIQDS